MARFRRSDTEQRNTLRNDRITSSFLIAVAVHLMRRSLGLLSSRPRCALTPWMRTEVSTLHSGGHNETAWVRAGENDLFCHVHHPRSILDLKASLSVI